MGEWADEWRAVGDIGVPGFRFFRLGMTGDCPHRGLRETVAGFKVNCNDRISLIRADNDDGGIDNRYLSEVVSRI